MNRYRTSTTRWRRIRTSVFQYLDWLIEDQALDSIEVTHITQAYNITRKSAQGLLDEWRLARVGVGGGEEA